MSKNAGKQAANSMGNQGFGCELAVIKGIQHRCVRAQVSAPAHANRRENRNLIAADDAPFQKGWDQRQSRAY